MGGLGEKRCCARECVHGLAVHDNEFLRTLHIHGRAYAERLIEMGGNADTLPTTGLGFIKSRVDARAAAPAAGIEAFKERDRGRSVSEAVHAHLQSLYPSKEALRPARDLFVVAALRDLLLRGCCMRAVRSILVASNNYFYLPGKGGGASRLRRAGFHGNHKSAPLTLVSVEDLATLDFEINEPCTCCRSPVSAASRCMSRPYSPLKLLEMRLAFTSASASGETKAQRIQIMELVWHRAMCRPSAVSLPWLADLLGVGVGRLRSVQNACAAAVRHGDVTLASVTTHYSPLASLPPTERTHYAAVAQTLAVLTRGEPGGKHVARFTVLDHNSLRSAFTFHASVFGDASCSRTTFRRTAKVWLVEQDYRCFASESEDHNVCGKCTALAGCARFCSVEAGACKMVADGRGAKALLLRSALLPAFCDAGDVDLGDAARARALFLKVGLRAQSALKEHCARDITTRVWLAATVRPPSSSLSPLDPKP